MECKTTMRLVALAAMLLWAGANSHVRAAEHSIDLSGEWKFEKDPEAVGESEGWFAADFDDSDWKTIEVPGPWDGAYDGVGWYRRSVEVDPDFPIREAVLLFRQADDHARVYLNGRLVAENLSWNSPFHVELDEALGEGFSPGDAIHLAVRVEDTGGAGGLLQPVRMLVADSPEDLYRSEWYDQEPLSTLEEMGRLVMYSVYVRNFSEEGTFEGLRRRLPELQALGVNILWLLPIHEIGVEKRKGVDGSPYAIRDYFSVNPKLGTEEDFRRLVDDAHAHGMKLIIDAVLNHTAPDSVHVREHPDWFIKDDEGNPVPEVAFWSDVVDWDWDVEEVWAHNAEALEYWVREFDIDGYRCDVADMIPRRFWIDVRKRLEKIKPDIVMLAESQQPYHLVEGFDLTYDDHIYGGLVSALAGEGGAGAMREAIRQSGYGYPEGSAQMMFIENHDKERAVHVMGGPERAKPAGAIMATLPGVPLLYTGTETGAAADRNETFFVRSPVDFSTDRYGMREHYATLLAMRQSRPELKTGDIELLDAEPADRALAYERREGEARSLLIFNLSGEATRIELEHDLMPTETLLLGPWGWAVY